MQALQSKALRAPSAVKPRARMVPVKASAGGASGGFWRAAGQLAGKASHVDAPRAPSARGGPRTGNWRSPEALGGGRAPHAARRPRRAQGAAALPPRAARARAPRRAGGTERCAVRSPLAPPLRLCPQLDAPAASHPLPRAAPAQPRAARSWRTRRPSSTAWTASSSTATVRRAAGRGRGCGGPAAGPAAAAAAASGAGAAAVAVAGRHAWAMLGRPADTPPSLPAPCYHDNGNRQASSGAATR
jgi:hypothetical protein